MIRNGGRVLFTSTGLTRYVANPAYSVYAAMKGAIEIYAKYAAKALGARAITVNALAPGATATDCLRQNQRRAGRHRNRLSRRSALAPGPRGSVRAVYAFDPPRARRFTQ